MEAAINKFDLQGGLQRSNDLFGQLWTCDLSSHARKQEEKNGEIHHEIEEYLALRESLALKSMVYKHTFVQINLEDFKRELEENLTRSLNSLSSIIHRE